MAKSAFKRGLSLDALQSVKALLDTEIGQRIKEESKLNICIREDYVNIYCNGSSILKFTPCIDRYEIHYKYTKEPKSGNYLALNLECGDLVVGNFSLSKLLISPECYIGDYVCGEKEHLARYLSSEKSPTIIDLEVAYTCKQKGKNGRGYVAKRIDLAVIENNKLQLIEVKIDTDSRLRSKKDGDQEILEQMKSYREFIASESANIIQSYKTIAQNIIDLDLVHKMGGTPKFTVDNLQAFIRNEECLALEPVLLVVETGKSKIGRNGIDHWDRLLSQLDKLGFPPPRTWTWQEPRVVSS